MTEQEKELWFARQWNLLNKSRYAVERAFNGLPLKEKQIIIVLANILPAEDLREPHLTGYQLSHYSPKGQGKIAYAVRLIRNIANAFPQTMSTSDFYKTDPNYNAEVSHE